MKRILLIFLVCFVIITCYLGNPNPDPVREKGYPISNTEPYTADSTLYYKNLHITKRDKDTTPYKGNWVDISH